MMSVKPIFWRHIKQRNDSELMVHKAIGPWESNLLTIFALINPSFERHVGPKIYAEILPSAHAKPISFWRDTKQKDNAE